MSLTAKQWLERINALDLKHPLRILNVCGGHERTITMAGLRGVLAKNIELIPGPGCPVCICPEEDVFDAIQISLIDNVTLIAFGDMLRVPVNAAKKEIRSLEQARTAGADVRPIASPAEAVKIAKDSPNKKVVFFAAGFETTMAPVAAMLAAGVPENLSLLLSGRLTWPAVASLLNTDLTHINALVAPGHVATIMGAHQWRFVVDKHNIPTAVAGFTPSSLLAAIYSIMRQTMECQCFLDNCYTQVVSASGNQAAQQILSQVMKVSDANWRGVGIIADSGFKLSGKFKQYDARERFSGMLNKQNRKRAGLMPPGCDCAQVILGKIYPDQCRLYGSACKPRNPIGPCMVSDEGACRIWWSAGKRKTVEVQSH